jgi:hypothetical protein
MSGKPSATKKVNTSKTPTSPKTPKAPKTKYKKELFLIPGDAVTDEAIVDMLHDMGLFPELKVEDLKKQNGK